MEHAATYCSIIFKRAGECDPVSPIPPKPDGWPASWRMVGAVLPGSGRHHLVLGKVCRRVMTEILRVRFTLAPDVSTVVRFSPTQIDGHFVSCFVEPAFVRVVLLMSGNRLVIVSGDDLPLMTAGELARLPLKLVARVGTYASLELRLPPASGSPVEGVATLVLHPETDLRPLDYTLCLKASPR